MKKPVIRSNRKKLGRGTRVSLWVGGSLLSLTALLVIGVLLIATGLSNAFNANVDLIPADKAFPSESGRPAASQNGAQNILFIGSDSRGTVADVGQSDVLDQRSDVIMVVHIPADRKNVQVMSIMRDSWVDIPGHGEAKINAAFAWGGAPLAIATIENLISARIDHVAIIGFDGFKDMTDALGGVTVESPKAFTVDQYSYRAGPNHLNGDQALTFVRARYPFADGDYQRVRDQQEFMNAIAKQAISTSTLSSPERIFEFANAVTKHLSVDQGFSFQTMFEVGISLRDVRPADVTFFTMPTSGTGMIGDQSVVLVDRTRLPALTKAFASDTLRGFAGDTR